MHISKCIQSVAVAVWGLVCYCANMLHNTSFLQTEMGKSEKAKGGMKAKALKIIGLEHRASSQTVLPSEKLQ